MKKLFLTSIAALLAASVLFTFAASAGVLGDIDGNENVTSDDAVYLLRYTLFPEYYPLTVFADFDHNDMITSDDAVYLLRYILFPDYYPLTGDEPELEPTPDECFEFALLEDGTYEITNYLDNGGSDVVVPSAHDGEPVTRIGGHETDEDEDVWEWFGAFENSKTLVSVTIPDSVTEIGSYAFFECARLAGVTIGTGVTEIGDHAFCECGVLTDIYYNGTKAQWESIEKGEEWDHDIGDHVIHCADGDIICLEPEPEPAPDEYFEFALLEDGTYELINYLAEERYVVIPSAHDGEPVTRIGGHETDEEEDVWEWFGAFENSKNLVSVTIPRSVTEIGSYAFFECANLADVTIGVGVTEIGSYAFCECGRLTDIYYKGTMAQWESIEKGVNWDSDTDEYVVHCKDGNIY